MLDSIQEVPHYIKRIYDRILGSIAFYPILISFVFMALAIALTIVGLGKYNFLPENNIPFLTITDSEIAQTILSTIIGGILSLTVFSFSMVMVVLSQASSNFSPRLLPGLISDKKHQAILGFYTGTLLYTFIILINLGALAGRDEDLGLATMLGSIFGVCCVVLFVYFIHSISQSIQIDNIIQGIGDETQKQLEDLTNAQKPDTSANNALETVPSRSSGYYRDFNKSILQKFDGDEQKRIEIIPYFDKYVWEGEPLFKITKGVREELKEEIGKKIHLSALKHDGEGYLGGMTKLMEVAVKAMSPGINDPGTAVDAIIKLSQLLRMAFKMPSKVQIDQPNESVQLIQNNIEANELLRIIIQPIRHYSQKDYTVLSVLTEGMNCIRNDTAIIPSSRQAILHQLALIQEDIIASGHHKSNEAHFEGLFSNT